MYQSQLPATGAPVSVQRTGQVKELFAEYVRQKTLENWKFYIVSQHMSYPRVMIIIIYYNYLISSICVFQYFVSDDATTQFSKIMEPMLDSYDSSTSTSSVNELCKTTMHWLDTSCSLGTLRRGNPESFDNSIVINVFTSQIP